jgi:glycosyltransferase involved in cell wall biosynthesis
MLKNMTKYLVDSIAEGSSKIVENIQVSVICTAYNHEKFIADAIESIIMQKTDFAFELIIHDDASTDNTATIIKSYEEKYPSIIRAIYRTENMYSKGFPLEEWLINNSEGQYIALCEGDDYWLDENKLQKQYEYLQQHPHVSLCVHSAKEVDALTKKLKSYCRPSKQSRFFTVEEIIYGGGGLFATNSMFFRKQLASKEYSFMEKAPVTDYAYAIMLALQGDVYYLDECLSVYRVNVPNSWTTTHFAKGETYRIHFQQIGEMLSSLNETTNNRYDASIQQRILLNEYITLVKVRDFKRIKDKKFRSLEKSLPWQRKLIFKVERYLPAMFHYLKQHKGLIHWAIK